MRYKGELKLKNGGVLLDWFPMDGGFRLTAGALHNGNELTGKSKQTASGEYTIGDKKYAVDGQVKAKADWRSFAPYLGLGWGNAVANKSKLSVNADLGIMFTGKPRVKLKTTDSNLNNDPDFMQDLKREEKKLAKDIKSVRYYPVAQIGISYSF
ncbi:MAG: hypothetical protein M0Q29_01000 [Thiopseudomonas sp.]|nr:hypothetical protein [Thiopseudomonas sp.]MCK9464444.1 hypothetical protein [Thiopseudomonas sp.]